MGEWKKQNKGYKYMLNVIDVFSKYAWSIPMKNKTGLTTLEALRKIAKESGRIPKHLWVDRGLEFYNKDVKSWLKENNIIMYSTYSEHKSVVVERIQNTKTRPRPIRKPRLKKGDKVRISRVKSTFEKGYLANWSEELYVVDKVQKTIPVTYKLKDLLGEEIEGSFYEEELQKSQQEVYRVERVIRKKKIDGIEHALVKWSGYNEKFNQWIPMKETQKLI